MYQKETKSDFYIAGEHWFNTKWISVVIGLIFIGIPYYYSIIDIDNLGWWPVVINPILIWISTKFSAKLINKWYDSPNGYRIAIISTVYTVIIYILLSFIDFSGDTTSKVDIISDILCAIVFYFESIHSIKSENEDDY